MKKDIIAKLLAEENLTILRVNAKTASFDLKDRVLRLPAWKDITNYEELLLKLHEVGHALYTPLDMDPDHKKFWSAINVVEDARIERLIKSKYRGAAAAMRKGYTSLIEKDFFGTNDTDLNDLNTLDKINLHFKIGDVVNIPLTEEEKVWVNKIEKAEDYDEAVWIAYQLNGIAKAQEEEKEQQMEPQGSGESSDDQGQQQNQDQDQGDEMNGPQNQSSDEDEDRGEDTGESSGNDDLSKTQQRFDENLDNRVVNDHRDYTSVFLPAQQDWKSAFIGYKEFYKDLTSELVGSPELDAEFTKFLSESKKSVAFLTAEFNRRKSAQDYRKSYSSRSGDIDVSKVWKYKISDNIFKTNTISPKGKNHGFVMYVDWSGSMADKLHDTVKQTINLAQFARRINVPFEVLLFSNVWDRDIFDPYNYDEDDAKQYEYGELHQGQRTRGVKLLQVLSSTMSNNEFREASKKLFWLSVKNSYAKTSISFYSLDDFNHKYGLGGTPLNAALVYGMSFSEHFVRKNRVEKLNVIVLTDGEDTGSFENYLDPNSSLRTHESEITKWYNDDATVEVYDRKTHKTYSLIDKNAHTSHWNDFRVDTKILTSTFAQIYRDRLNATLTGLFIGSKSDLNYHLKRSLTDQDKIKTLKRDLNKFGFIPFPDKGMNTNLLVVANNHKSDEEMVMPKVNKVGKITKGAFVSSFKKSLNNKAANKNMLRELSKIVA